MFSTADLGKDVKLVLIDSSRVRGYVAYVSAEKQQVGIEAERGRIDVKFDRISTVTWIGDHTS